MNNSDFYVRDIDSISSPQLVYFQERIKANIDAALGIGGGPERLCPHIKSHKTREIVRMQMDRGITKFKCSTVAEAEMLAQSGVREITLAYPIVGPSIPRTVVLSCLYPEIELTVLVDDENCARELSKESLTYGRKMKVLVDIDPGLHRTGVRWGAPATAFYQMITSLPGLEPTGLHCYDGHNHQPSFEERCAAADECYEQVISLKETLKERGLPVPRIIMGGTPTFPCYARKADVELSPGTGFLHDYGYMSTFEDLPFQPAAALLTRVISRASEGYFTLDLGNKAIAADPPGVRGIIVGHENAEAVLHNEEHWMFRLPDKEIPPVGTPLWVIPTHVCPCSALYPSVPVVDGKGEVIGSWEIAARNRKICV
jgi:D-threonine aldolase